MEKISTDFTKEELGRFLKKRYRYGYWNFADSLVSVYMLYIYRKHDKFLNLLSERINNLEKIKTKIIELIDFFLIDINFYKEARYRKPFRKSNDIFKIKNFKWTLDKKQDFIIKSFDLNPCFSVINKQINYYKRGLSSSLDDGKLKIYLKPRNLIIMVWSYALKKGKKIEWKNMEALLNWFSRKVEEVDLLDFYGFEKNNIPSPEIMRLIKNKYKGTHHEITATILFSESFVDEKLIAESKKKIVVTDAGRFGYSDPLKWLDEYTFVEPFPKRFMMLLDLGFILRLLEKYKNLSKMKIIKKKRPTSKVPL